MAIDLTGGINPEREYVFAECPETPGIRDAVNVWLEAADGAFGMRIGVEAVSPDWDQHQIWLDLAFADGRVLSVRDYFPVRPAIGPEGRPTILGAGPLQFRCVEPFRRWTVAFAGQARETTTTDLMKGSLPAELPMTDLEFTLEMTMAAPPWAPGSLLAEAGDALKGEQGEFMSPRYEQLFRATGAMRVGEARLDVAANGLRIRRQGPRKFEGFWGHCWQSALFPSGKAFGCNNYPPRDDGQPSYNEGYVFGGDGALKPARVVQAPWLTKLAPRDDDATLVLETADGETITIEGQTFANTRSLSDKILPASFPIVQQAHARYRWDGEETFGMLERSTLPEKMTG
ncbi:hypothetical protein LJR219_003989 [Phenylobacterium sp. LjRoot219]|uniref:DUF7064 domain-containing protein n=1 Tax=Phenylobacterium sp. LjRoot219 TaxID=3342283 RepID=UPI003ED12A2A